MKYLLISFLILATFQSTFAQSTTTKSSTSINISISSDDKLKLNLDDEKMNLSYKFPKEKTLEMIEAFNTHLDAPRTIDVTRERLEAKKKGYKISIQRGKLEAWVDRTTLKEEDAEQLIASTQAALKAFGVNINTSFDLDWN